MAQLRFLLVPFAIILFNVTFIFIMRTILLAVPKTQAPFFALAIATVVLGGAAYLARREPESTPSESVEH